MISYNHFLYLLEAGGKKRKAGLLDVNPKKINRNNNQSKINSLIKDWHSKNNYYNLSPETNQLLNQYLFKNSQEFQTAKSAQLNRSPIDTNVYHIRVEFVSGTILGDFQFKKNTKIKDMLKQIFIKMKESLFIKMKEKIDEFVFLSSRFFINREKLHNLSHETLQLKFKEQKEILIVAVPGLKEDLKKLSDEHTEGTAFNSDGTLLASGGNLMVQVWNTENNSLIKTLEHNDLVTSVAFSPVYNNLLACACDNGLIHLWNTQDFKCFRLLQGQVNFNINSNPVAFSPDGQKIASGSNDKKVKLWNVKDGSLIRTLEGHADYVESMAFSPSGKVLATGSAIRSVDYESDSDSSDSESGDGTVKVWKGVRVGIGLWNTEDGSLIRTLEGHAATVSSVAFSPDGKLLASGSHDKTVKLWNTEDGSLVRTLEGHTLWVNSVAFSPDGKVLASGSHDKTVKLWSTEDGSVIDTIQFAKEIESASIHGNKIAVATWDGLFIQNI